MDLLSFLRPGKSSETKNYAVLFPFMAEGHFIPFIALSQLIQSNGCDAVFINTPSNILTLKKSFPPSSAAVRFLDLPFDAAAHGLPPGTETADFLPYNLMVSFLEATTSLQLPFQRVLSDLIQSYGGLKPLFIVSDVFLGWAADVAGELGIFNSVFSATGGFGMACYCSTWLNLPHKFTDSVEFLLPDFPEAGKIHATQLTPGMLVGGDDYPMADFQRHNFVSAANSGALLLNTVEEIDGHGIQYFQRRLKIPVFAIGPLLLSQEDRARTWRRTTISLEKCIDFLDKKEENSVIYISFGSQNTIPAPQMVKLAKALEASRRNFIWVVRPPLGFDMNADFVAEEWLPEDFLERTKSEERGLIVSKWAPQLEILGHKSIGAFISHCGWNSVLETLKHGVPVIGWPMGADQFYNSHLLVQFAGVCVEVARGTSFDIPPEEIVKKIEFVMGETGADIRSRALEIKQIIANAIRDEETYKGSSVAAAQEFFAAALSWKQKMDASPCPTPKA